MGNGGRVVVIGLDGGTFDVILPLVERGILPNLSTLIHEGAWGTLRSTIPPHSAPAWNTFATGMNPGRHGVFGFHRWDRNTISHGHPELINARSVAGPTLWSIVSHKGLRVGVINVPMTYPPEPVNGFMVTGMMTPPSTKIFTYPPELSAALTDYEIDVTSGERYGAVASLDLQRPETRRWLCKALDRQLERRTQSAVRLIAEYQPDLLVLVFTETDRLQHYFWNYLSDVPDSSLSPDEVFFHRWVEDFYRRVDEAIGQVWAAMGPEAVRLVVSDHGFGPFPPREFYPNVWLRQKGWLRFRMKGSRGWLARWQMGVSQTWLRRALFFLPKHRQRALRLGLRKHLPVPVDWEHTQAYFVPLSTLVGSILILEDPSSEKYESICDSIAQDLVSLIDPATGGPIVKQVWRREQLYTGPFVGQSPDMIMILDPAYRAVGGLTGRAYLLEAAARISHWTGAHRFEGIFLAGGSPMRVGHLPPSRLEDMTPTILYLLGLPIPEDMDGKVLEEAIRPEWLRDAPLRRTAASYSRVDRGDAGWDQPGDEAEVMDRLRALGYVE